MANEKSTIKLLRLEDLDTYDADLKNKLKTMFVEKNENSSDGTSTGINDSSLIKNSLLYWDGTNVKSLAEFKTYNDGIAIYALNEDNTNIIKLQSNQMYIKTYDETYDERQVALSPISGLVFEWRDKRIVYGYDYIGIDYPDHYNATGWKPREKYYFPSQNNVTNNYFLTSSNPNELNDIHGYMSGLSEQLTQVSSIAGNAMEMVSNVFTKTEINNKLSSYCSIAEHNTSVTNYLKNYYTKNEANNTFYNKTEIDNKLSNISVSGGGNLNSSNYYTKSESYSKSDIDSLIGSYYNKETINQYFPQFKNIYTREQMSGLYYTKETVNQYFPQFKDVYTKTESNDRFIEKVAGIDGWKLEGKGIIHKDTVNTHNGGTTTYYKEIGLNPQTDSISYEIFKNALVTNRRKIVIEILVDSGEQLSADPISESGMTLGKWSTNPINLHNLISFVKGPNGVINYYPFSEYKNITVDKYQWVVNPETNGFQFMDSGFVIPQISQTSTQATLWSTGISFRNPPRSAEYNSRLIVSKKHIIVTFMN